LNFEHQNRGDALLQKWLAGSITWREERELEQLTQGDALLAEALTGLRDLPEGDHSARIAHLKTRLQNRTKRKERSLIFYLPRVAAAAAVLVLLGVGMWWLNEKEVETPIVQRPEAVPSNPSEPPLADVKMDTGKVLTDHSNEPPTKRKEIASNAPIAPAPVLKPTPLPAENTKVASSADAAPALPEAETPAIAAEERAVTEDAQKSEPAPAQTRAAAAAKKQASEISRMSAPNALQARIMQGSVTDGEGKPIAGVRVEAVGTNLVTVTDLEGNYDLALPFGVEQLVFSKVLYNSFVSQVADNERIDAVLEKHGLPEPVVGFKKMKDYIINNLRYPKAAREAKIEGKVVVAFTIIGSSSGQGSLTDFKIVESLGYGLDEEAIRLLREGPKWFPRMTIDTTQYTIEFRLK